MESTVSPWTRAILAMQHDREALSRAFVKLITSQSTEEAEPAHVEQLVIVMKELQTFIDEKHTHHRIFERYLKKLVLQRGILPPYLFVTGVCRLGEYPITGGGFSDLWRGKVDGRLVALKVIRYFSFSGDRDKLHRDFCKEAMIWRQLHHENVLPFYGVCTDIFSPQYAMVSPWMENGNLLAYLNRCPDANRMALMEGITLGLQYLHSLEPPVIHGDLRGANVLIDDDNRPRLGDFGLSRAIDSQGTAGSSHYGLGGCVRWHAPEMLHVGPFQGETALSLAKSDVYALACVYLEVFTGAVPFSNLNDGQVIIEVGVHDRRPLRPEEPAAQLGLDDYIWAVMQDCWKTRSADRPHVEIIAQRVVRHRYHQVAGSSQQEAVHDNSSAIERTSPASTLICNRAGAALESLDEDGDLDLNGRRRHVNDNSDLWILEFTNSIKELQRERYRKLTARIREEYATEMFAADSEHRDEVRLKYHEREIDLRAMLKKSTEEAIANELVLRRSDQTGIPQMRRSILTERQYLSRLNMISKPSNANDQQRTILNGAPQTAIQGSSIPHANSRDGDPVLSSSIPGTRYNSRSPYAETGSLQPRYFQNSQNPPVYNWRVNASTPELGRNPTSPFGPPSLLRLTEPGGTLDEEGERHHPWFMSRMPQRRGSLPLTQNTSGSSIFLSTGEGNSGGTAWDSTNSLVSAKSLDIGEDQGRRSRIFRASNAVSGTIKRLIRRRSQQGAVLVSYDQGERQAMREATGEGGQSRNRFSTSLSALGQDCQ